MRGKSGASGKGRERNMRGGDLWEDDEFLERLNDFLLGRPPKKEIGKTDCVFQGD